MHPIPVKKQRWDSVKLLFLIGLLSICHLPVFATVDEAVRLNDAGVKALNDRKYELAIDRFEAALKIDKDYSIAKKNLGITHIYLCLNWAQTRPLEALNQAHQARYLDRKSEKARATLDWIIRQLGKDPKLFSDRALLGLQAKTAGDFKSAIVEFRDALQIKNDKEISKKLEEIYNQLPEERQSIAEKEEEEERRSTVSEKRPSTDYDAYMRELSRNLKQSWHPPKLSTTNQTVVRFSISPQGELNNLLLATSSGVAEADLAAMKAVKDAAPFKALPSGEEKPVDILFTFDYNVFSGPGNGQKDSPAPNVELDLLRARTKQRLSQVPEPPQKTGIQLRFDYLPLVQDPLPQFPQKSSPLCDDKMLSECRVLMPARAW